MVMFRRLLPFIIIAAVPAVAHAQHTAAAPASHLPEIFVVGTRVPIEADESPTDLTIITSDQIDATQERTVAEALRDVVGLEVARNGQPGGQTSVFIRGANS